MRHGNSKENRELYRSMSHESSRYETAGYVAYTSYSAPDAGPMLVQCWVSLADG